MAEIALTVLVLAPPLLLAIILHEVAHGGAARALGDDTAERAGRLTLNPLKHVDPIGTLLVPGLLLLAQLPGAPSFLFGWAKPVPVGWGRLRSPRRDIALVAAAGPAANLVMLIGWIAVVALLPDASRGGVLTSTAHAGIIANTVLMALNLIPIPPLDGSRVVSSLLPVPAAAAYNRLERFGLLLVLLLLVTGVLQRVIGPALDVSLRAAAMAAG